MKFQELKELTENLMNIDTVLYESALNTGINLYSEALFTEYRTYLKEHGDEQNLLPLYKKRETILAKLKAVAKGDDVSRLYRCKVSVLKKHLAKSNEELNIFTIYNNDPYEWEDDPSVSVYFTTERRPYLVLHRAAMPGESIEENRQNILLTLTPLFTVHPFMHDWQDLLRDCPTIKEELWGALREQYNEIVSAKLEANKTALQTNERKLIELTNPVFLKKKIEELKRKEASISKKIKEDKEKFDEIDLNIFEN